jgi:hypothetical protein
MQLDLTLNTICEFILIPYYNSHLKVHTHVSLLGTHDYTLSQRSIANLGIGKLLLPSQKEILSFSIPTHCDYCSIRLHFNYI